jgi:transposase
LIVLFFSHAPSIVEDKTYMTQYDMSFSVLLASEIRYPTYPRLTRRMAATIWPTPFQAEYDVVGVRVSNAGYAAVSAAETLDLASGYRVLHMTNIQP